MHIILWQFTVHPDKRSEFIAAYGSDGLWAQLFRRSPSYQGTEILASGDQICFLTIDRWTSTSAFHDFQARFHTDYEKLDTELEGLTLRETKLGTYTSAT